MIILIVGDFCVGKDTVADLLKKESLTKHDCAKFKKILSYTTRLPREEEKNQKSTHIFCTKETFLSFNDIIAQTEIDGNYYGARAAQFDKNSINLYCVDSKGVYDIVNSNIDDVLIVEVIRPNWLIDCPKARLNRKRTYDDAKYSPDYIIINDGDLQKLEASVRECYEYLIREVKRNEKEFIITFPKSIL